MIRLAPATQTGPSFKRGSCPKVSRWSVHYSTRTNCKGGLCALPVGLSCGSLAYTTVKLALVTRRYASRATHEGSMEGASRAGPQT